MRILIVGGGKVAEELLKHIDPKKNQIYIVEKNPERRQVLMSKYDVFIIGKDASDVSLYASDVKLEQIDMVLALTNNDEVNILVLAIAKIYNVPYRIARVSDRKIAEVVRELGLGIPLSQPSIIASMIKNYLTAITTSLKLTSINLDGRNYHVYLLTISETDFASGMKIHDLERQAIEQGVIIKVLLVFNGEEFIQPNPDEELKPGYQILVLSSAPNVEKIIKG